MGAWIETRDYYYKRLSEETSHPMWVRGLKPVNYGINVNPVGVAPHVGAWIETILYK